MSDFLNGPLTDPLTQRLTPASVTLLDAASVAIDLSQADVFLLTLGGNHTLAAPTNTKGGQRFTLIVKQDAVGSRTLGFNAAYVFDRAPTLNSIAAAVTVFEFVYDGPGAKARCTCVSSAVGSTSAIVTGSITVLAAASTGTAALGAAYNGKTVLLTMKTPSAAITAGIATFTGSVAAGVLTVTFVDKANAAVVVSNDQVVYYLVDGR